MKRKLLHAILTISIFIPHLAISQSHSAHADSLGTVNDLYNYLISKPNKFAIGQINQKSIKVDSAKRLEVIMNTSTIINNINVLSGEVKGSKGSTVYFNFKDGAVKGQLVLQKEKRSYKYYSDANRIVWVEEEDIHQVICVDNLKTKDSTASVMAPPTGSSVYHLQSLPGAEAVVYLDFDGQVVMSSYWNGGLPIIAAPSNLTESEIIEAWKLISEDFRPFQLNITTDSAIYFNAPINKRVRCIFTPTTDANPGSGGVAYIGSFTWGLEVPCWAFNEGAKYAGETGSHEVGHTLGLSHDGSHNPDQEYYEGQGDWAPIMGVAYYRPIGQWSKGEYKNANNTEDDIAIIASNNGFGFRIDDFPNSIAGSKILNYDGIGNLSDNNTGVIEQRTDVDVFGFSTNGGNVTLNINPAPTHPDLDILAQISNASGTIYASSDPEGLSASINVNLPAGTYYLSIDGVGDADPLTNGYSDYASVGLYSISGKISNPVSNNKIPVVNITSPSNNAIFAPGSNITVNAIASDPDGFVAKVEFYNGNILLATDLIAPYSFVISNASIGQYQLKAIATDNQGGAGVSSIISISVTSVNKFPQVSIVSPENGITLAAGSNVVINATASDPDGIIMKVDFFDGNVFLGTDFSAPYSFTFNHIPVDGYYFKAVATDDKGAKTTSEPVSITAVAPGIYGPACLVPNQTYQYILYSDIPTIKVDWWVNGDASITKDPNNDNIAYFNFSIWNSGSLQLSAGADLQKYPWYRKYDFNVNVNGCGNSVAGLMKTSSTNNQILVSVENGGNIRTVKIFDLNGREIINSENNNSESVVLAQEIPDGIYIVRALTDQGMYINKIAKIK